MLTPQEIRNKTFEKTFGFGYRMDDVDSFLEETALALSRAQELNDEVESKLEVLADKLSEYREDEESLRTALLGAQKLGDSVIRESKTKAEIILRDATIKAETMIDNAKRQIEHENDSLVILQQEVAKFKNRLLALYKQHLELVSALPGEVDAPADKPADKPVDKPAAEPEPERTGNKAEPEEEKPEAAGRLPVRRAARTPAEIVSDLLDEYDDDEDEYQPDADERPGNDDDEA